MNPDSITVSLEWARKLKKAGWRAAAHYWTKRLGDFELVTSLELVNPKYTVFDWFPAPTSEEILQEIKRRLKQDWGRVLQSLKPYLRKEKHVGNAAAAMYVYLSAHNLLS